MLIRTLMALAILAWPALAAGQERRLVDCDAIELGPESIVAGADLSGVRTYYQGRVTLYLLDRVEPACCSWGVAIVMPAAPSDGEPESLTCWAVSGYAGVDLRRATSRYDPRQGLLLSIPTRDYDHDTGGTRPGAPLRLRIDAGRGTIEQLGGAR